MQNIWARHCAEGERFRRVETSLSENVPKNLVDMGCLG